MKITLNLASRPFTDLTDIYKRLRMAMGILALAAIALGLLLHFVMQQDQRAYQRTHLIDDALTQMGGERQGYESLMQQPSNAKVLLQTEALNGLFDEKAFSWTLVMKDLETVLPDPVQVTEIEPVRTKDGQVILHQSARTARPKYPLGRKHGALQPLPASSYRRREPRRQQPDDRQDPDCQR